MPDRTDVPTELRRTIGDVTRNGAARLRASGSPTPRLDADLLMGHLLGRDRAWVLAHPEASVDVAAYDALIARRAAGEPVAYIRGFKEWYSLRIRTDARALIPRPETELLADATVAEIASRLEMADRRVVAWEVATGSGAVGIAIALRFRVMLADGSLELIASDISDDALALAAENLAEHGVVERVRLARGDLLEPAGAALPRPDVVAANLPYVSSEEVDARRGLGYEPRIAVDGGPDGLSLLRPFLSTLHERTAPGATAFLELGLGQVETVRHFAPPGASVSVVQDLAGLERVVRVQLR